MILYYRRIKTLSKDDVICSVKTIKSYEDDKWLMDNIIAWNAMFNPGTFYVFIPSSCTNRLFGSSTWIGVRPWSERKIP
jgi:hypothetical protein